MTLARPATLLAGLVLLAGCGAQVTVQGHTVREGRPDVVPGVRATARGDAPVASVRAVTVNFTPAVRQQLQAVTSFDADVFIESVTKELAARGRFDAAGAGPELEILVDALEAKPTGGAAIMGNVAAAGILGGRVRLLGVDLIEQHSFNVLGESEVGIPREGVDSGALRPLYRRFALLLADELDGTPGKSVPPPAKASPR